MSRAEEIRRDQERAQAARPAILERLREGREPLEVSHEVSERFDVDASKAYRWVAYIAEDFQRRRRRVAFIGLSLLWPGMLMLVAGPTLWLFGVPGPGIPFWLLGLVVGVPLSCAGAWLAISARRLVRVTV
ncbi:MAG: hypothetical protein ACOC2D_00820 [Spirochaetota bacterium]